MKPKKKYNINQSPLYKINSHKKLSQCLGLKSKETISSILKRGSDNYYISVLKPSGRVIEVPKIQLTRVHKRINHLLSRIEVPEYLNSGVKGRSNVQNARDHLGQHALLRLDIKKFYQSITEQQIARCFVSSFSCSKDVAETLAKLCTIDGHLPTGSSISQSISFMVNRPVFNHINTYSKSRGLKFTCYVDDLTFSGTVIPKNFSDYVKDYIKRVRGYDCHKYKMHKADTAKLVTGAVIVGDVLKVKNCHRHTIDNLRNKYDHMVATYEPDSIELTKYFQCFKGHLFSAAQINARYRQEGQKVTEKHRQLLANARES